MISPASIGASVAALHAAVQPTSVVDIASCDDDWAAAFEDAGADVLVVRPPHHPALTRAGAPTVAHDLRRPLVLDRKFDLAISIGDGRDVPTREALALVASLCAAADVVAFATGMPRLVPPGTVTAPVPLRWDAIFERQGFLAREPGAWAASGGAGRIRPDLVVYARSGRIDRGATGSQEANTTGLPDREAWSLLQRQLLDSESRADRGHRDAVLLWAALVATQRQLVASTYRLLHSPDGGPLDRRTLVARGITGSLPLRRGLRNVLGPPALLWDRMWYLSRYPDVATARVSPLWHYRRHGAQTRRSPHPWIDPAWYAAHNPDVVAEGADPVEHYMKAGWKQGRDPHPLFDTRWYQSQRGEGDSWRRSPLEHYLRRGRGASPHPLIDPAFYRHANPDVAATGTDPVAHFLSTGWWQGRDPHPLFDVRWYLETYVDVAREGLNPLVHYLAVGWEQGCDPHPMFDTSWYLDTYPDVVAAEQEPLGHYLTVGAAEGRAPGPLFDTAWYVDRHPEAAAESRNPLAYFVTEGSARGDAPAPWAEEDLHTDLAPTRALMRSLQS